MDATTTRASLMPINDTRAHASITMPLSITRSSTSMRPPLQPSRTRGTQPIIGSTGALHQHRHKLQLRFVEIVAVAGVRRPCSDDRDSDLTALGSHFFRAGVVTRRHSVSAGSVVVEQLREAA